MSDTSHHQNPAESGPTEGDGVSYRGLVWFGVILAATTVACQLLMWGMFAFMEHQASADDVAKPALAGMFSSENPQCHPVPSPTNSEPEGVTPCIAKDGQVLPGRTMPAPNLMADDPLGLRVFRAKEDEILGNYGVMDKNAGTYRIPIERAKELLLQRGIPGGVIPPAAPAPAVKK